MVDRKWTQNTLRVCVWGAVVLSLIIHRFQVRASCWPVATVEKRSLNTDGWWIKEWNPAGLLRATTVHWREERHAWCFDSDAAVQLVSQQSLIVVRLSWDLVTGTAAAYGSHHSHTHQTIQGSSVIVMSLHSFIPGFFPLIHQPLAPLC